MSQPIGAAAPAPAVAKVAAVEADKPGSAGSVASKEDIEAAAAAGSYVQVTYMDIFKQFILMGWTAFGGPAAHIGLFQKVFVDRLKWMSSAVFMELFALGQCLPGPTSTQVSFGLGTLKKGLLGGLLSGLLFQYPGAIMMTAAGAGAAAFLVNPGKWLAGGAAGLSAVGVALVACAAKSLLTKLCAERVLAVLATLSAAAAVYWAEPWLFPLCIIIGGCVTAYTKRKQDLTIKGNDDSIQHLGVNIYVGGVLIAIWAVLLAVSVGVVAAQYDRNDRKEPSPLQIFEVFFRTGSIIFGGGQVVLPLLLNDVVKYDCASSQLACLEEPLTPAGRSWVTAEQFYAGMGVVQAMPGPLFNFAAYLGAIIAKQAGYSFMTGTVLAWLGLFGPGILLIFGVLPYWSIFRKWDVYRQALPGLNAAAVGLVVAALFKMVLDVWKISPFPVTSLCIGLLAFTAVDQLKLFEPAVVLAGAVLGIIAVAGKMN